MFRRAEPDKIARARRLRHAMTVPEKRLWWKLKQLNAQGHHFRRQAPFGIYTLDFVEHEARIVIELDGDQHGRADRAARDRARDRKLAEEGYQTLRFSNEEVKENVDGVAEAIVRAVAERIDRPPPARSR